jgi:hypothetical protein
MPAPLIPAFTGTASILDPEFVEPDEESNWIVPSREVMDRYHENRSLTDLDFEALDQLGIAAHETFTEFMEMIDGSEE